MDINDIKNKYLKNRFNSKYIILASNFFINKANPTNQTL